MTAHIAAGMHGAVIIDPPGLEPVAREVRPRPIGDLPDRPGGLPRPPPKRSTPRPPRRTPPATWRSAGWLRGTTEQPLTARVGDRVRVWIRVDAGRTGPQASTSSAGNSTRCFPKALTSSNADVTPSAPPAAAPNPRGAARAGRVRRVDRPRGGPLFARDPHHGRRRARRFWHPRGDPVTSWLGAPGAGSWERPCARRG